jgi:hypothetical protein
MARPAIIIGLGGTGQQIVTFLKKELLEIGGGQLPKEVKLLAFDTASRVNPQGSVDREKVYRLGNVALEENREYVCIGDALYQEVQRIKVDQERVESGQSAQLSHLHWFPAKELIERGLPQAAFNTTQGAGAYRTLGRLSLFHSVYSVLGHLEQAMTKLKTEVRGTRSEVQDGSTDIRLLEIIVVGSLAGGTGAGTFIDMAWLARSQANAILQDKYTLRGFFLLPTTFTTGGIGRGPDSTGKQGRGFAAWHELDRAMLSGGSGNQIIYNPADKNLHISCDVPAYDITYLIDPLRDTLPIHPPPEEGIFPAVAHLVSFLLDEEAGRRYTENLINVLVDTRGNLPKGVYHSSIGAYTLKVPVYYTQAQFSHKLAQQVLDVFLAPEKNDKERVTHLSQLSNGEAGEGMAGLQAAVSFLTGDMQRSGEQTIPNTKLLQVIGQHRAKKAQEDDAQVRNAAQGGLTTSLLPYFNALNQITEYNPDTGQMESHDFTGELQWKIWQECSPSKRVGDAPDTAWTRLTSDATARSVPNVRKRRFGVEAVVKSSGPQLRGEFGTELEVPKTSQLKRFRELLQAQTLRDLNGTNPDARIARGGKLGYVRALYKELSDTLAYFGGFLDDVRKVRSEDLKQAQVTRDAADRALKRYNAEKTKRCWLTFWDGNVHPDAHRAQRNWLRAEQRDIDRRRGDILLDVLDEAAAAMKDYTDKTLADIDSWIDHLAVGDPTFSIESLYSQVTESLAGVEVNHALDQRLGNANFRTEKTLGKVSQIITEHTFQHDEDMIAESLEQIKWEAAQEADGLKLNCGVELPGKTPESPPEIRAFRRDGENPAGDNLRLLIRLTERPYAGVQRDYPLAKEISDVYPDGKSLANALHGHAEPFYRFRHGTVPAAVQQAFLRVNDDNNAAMQDYFGVQFRSEFLTANPELGGQLDKVSSKDRYKLTLVRSDDLMPSESFDQWHICFEPYQGMFANLTPREIHIFTAEQNAARYERAMPRKLRQNYRILRPEVVALLEDRRHFEMFFRAYAHGFIAKMVGDQDGVKHRFWGYQLPQHDEPLYLIPPMIDADPPGMFELIHNYLSGHDRRKGYDKTYLINWQELRQAIAKSEQELDREKCTELYKTQSKDQPDSLIKAILSEGESTKALPAHQQYREQAVAAHQKYADLADVAQLIFLQAIEKLQQPTW